MRKSRANASQRNRASSGRDDHNGGEQELISLAWAMARVPTCDLHGLQIKADAYVQLRGLELARRPETAADALLLSLICDLLRGTKLGPPLVPHAAQRKSRQPRSQGKASVDVVRLDIERLQRLALDADLMADLLGDVVGVDEPGSAEA
jgi:hypothetical protein